MRLTINEAQALHNTYGTVFEIDGDRSAVIVYDDDVDVSLNWPITVVDIETGDQSC